MKNIKCFANVLGLVTTGYGSVLEETKLVASPLFGDGKHRDFYCESNGCKAELLNVVSMTTGMQIDR